MILHILFGIGIVAITLVFGDVPSKLNLNNNSVNLEVQPQTSILELPILSKKKRIKFVLIIETTLYTPYYVCYIQPFYIMH